MDQIILQFSREEDDDEGFSSAWQMFPLIDTN